MPSVTKNAPPGAVAAPSAAPYTGPVSAERMAASVPWWKDAVRSWAPVLGFAVLLVFQMVSLQQQIGELRTDLHREIGGLRDDLRTDIGALGERIARLEALLERAGGAASRPGE